ncbi:hypothetical protein RHSIM_Rhsim04G0188900 [Rhododendron simsii]|uniref:C2H2-type domain-containing protein n=1 Tax=Rhododendron simsii TaxID=118357 RepID=A0A834LNB9_RHOSS|nr:hypothetical protein RHSIM_Rhsim04G0188900 [Rhododendron simsii]
MDQPEKVAKVRTYDCTYCKRGFTKAQALGGHMNIHSKRKAGKAKTVASHHDQYSSSLTHKAKNDSDYNNMANNCENFSLRIGPIIVVDGDNHQERNEVVDVELRLGFNS